MKKIVAIALASALALGLSSCAVARAGSEARSEGSVVASEQPAQLEPAVAEPEPETEPEIEAPVYDPIELDYDNPLADVEIASVQCRLYGVGALELEGADKETILGIAVNDARVFKDENPEGPGYTLSNGKLIAGPRFVITLESGEELVLLSLQSEGFAANFYINNFRYELSDEEYQSFKALYDESVASILNGADETVTPFADLSANDLIKITRVQYASYDYDGEYPLPEQVLSDEQLEQVIETLQSLEMEPATANPEMEMLYGGSGGGYGKFELWFKSGAHYVVGCYTQTDYETDENGKLITTPVVFIDDFFYDCNRDFVESLGWDYEETDPEYVRWYLSAREIAEYPFEKFTGEEIKYASMALEDDSLGWTTLVVPRSMNDEIADALRGIRYSDENEVETNLLGLSDDAETAMTLWLSNGEYVLFGLVDDEAVLNFYHFRQEKEVVEAIEKMFEDVRDEYKDLIESNGERNRISVRGTDSSSDVDQDTGELIPVTEYTYFELPRVLVEHEDGYYPEGSSLEDAPLSVQVFSYDTIGGDKSESFVTRLKEDMEAADGEGYYSGQVSNGKSFAGIIIHWNDDGQIVEAVVTGGSLTRVEVYIKGDGDYEITPEAVYMLVVGTMDTQRVRE